MSQIALFYDKGAGFGNEPELWLDVSELNGREIALPGDCENVRLSVAERNVIVDLVKVQGYCGFWYALTFMTDGFRLGHDLYLFGAEGGTVTGEDFRYGTTKLMLSLRSIPLPTESAEKLLHDVKRLQADREELTRKWKYQTQVYDEKVKDVVRLERDKVELNEAIDELRGEVEFWRSHYRQMEGSLSWKLTAPVRSFNASVKALKDRGPLNERKKAYQSRLTALREQEALRFSLLADVRGLSEEALFSFVEHVTEQQYGNYELLLLGGGKLAQWFARVDQRIRSVPEDKGLQGLADAATGAYLGMLAAGDRLTGTALRTCAEALARTGAAFLYTDSAYFTERPEQYTDPQYKPDFSPDFLRSKNYIRGFFAAKKELFSKISYDTEELCGAKWYGMILHLTELAENAGGVSHVPELCYLERHEELSGSVLEAENDAARRALREHLTRVNLPGTVETLDKKKGLFHIRYDLNERPLISILIPNKDHVADLKRCIDSVLRLSTYRNFEIVVVENNSAKKETFGFYEELTHGYAAKFSRIETHDGGRTLLDEEKTAIPIRVIRWEQGFNFSAINNFGVPETRGEYLLLLNNDIEVRTSEWIEELLMFAQRPDVGAVGAKLYYPDDTVQHAGVIIGLGGVAAHSHLAFPKDAAGYMDRLLVAQNLSAVTAACLLMRRSVYEEVGGMDPAYQVAFNDADFCMRIRAKGYNIVFTPFAELMHDESKSRGVEDTPEKAERFESEVQRFRAEWPDILSDGDPYYNPHLTTDTEDFSIKE